MRKAYKNTAANLFQHSNVVRCWYVRQLITLELVANEIKEEWVSAERLGYVSLLKVQVAVDIFSKLFAFSPVSLFLSSSDFHCGKMINRMIFERD